MQRAGELTTDREETLWTRLCEEYDKYWTPTGQVRGDRRSLGRRVEEAQDRVTELTRQLQEIESDAAQMRLAARRISSALRGH